MSRKDKGAGHPWSFTPEQEQFIRKWYRRLSRKELGEAFREAFGPIKTDTQIVAFIKNHKIQSGRTGCFEKGHQPWNTGTKGLVTPNSGNFRKGNIPPNKRRLWSERISKDGYIEISVPEVNPHTGHPTRFKHKHVWIWEGEYGRVPAGHCVLFKDANKRNFDIENLILVTRSEMLSLNLHGYKDMPVELKPSILALAKMEAKAGIRTRPGRGRQGNGNRAT